MNNQSENLQILASSHSFDGYAVYDVHRKVDGRLFPTLGLTDLSQDLTRQLEALPDLNNASVFRMLMTTNQPFRWMVGVDTVTGTRIGRTKTDESWDEALDKADFAGGYCVPARAPGKRNSAVVYFKKQEKPKARYADLVLDTLELYEREIAEPVDATLGDQDGLLSTSERSCLVWGACGKTSSEIGTILSLSEHTVNHYFTLAGQKLGTTNRVHTVARAIKLGLIDLSELS